MDTIRFENEPSFAELWNVCLYNFLYNIEDYKKDIEELFSQIGITKESKILDVSAGGGFPAIDLIKDGYQIDCLDISDDEIKLFDQRANELNLSVRCKKGAWLDIPKLFEQNTYDFIFCRGNSFIYAAGGWNEKIEIDRQQSLDSYLKTLKIFKDALKSGGHLYLDKFKDKEAVGRKKVCKIQIGEESEENLFFQTQISPEENTRRAALVRASLFGKKEGFKKATYNLTETETEELFKKAEFRENNKLDIPSEKYFVVWLAKK
jgi:SAM-dependent methyltransferase